MTRAETLTPVLPQRFAPNELEAAARWVGDRARRAVSSPARLVATFRALDGILARSPDVVALRDLLPGSGLEILYLPPSGAATVTQANLSGEIYRDALVDIGRALRAEFIASEGDMMQIEADDGARLIVHAIEVRALVLVAANVQLIDAH